MTEPDLGAAEDLAAFIDASPSPYHACAEAARRLAAVGFGERAEHAAWEGDAGPGYVLRGGSLVAWLPGSEGGAASGFRLLGAHSDSPNLRVKPRPDTGKAGLRQLGVEVYGGVLLNSWLDRDLGLSGRVMLRGDDRAEARLFHIDRPILRVPQLAIHLHGEIRSEGLKLNKQKHMSPMFGTGECKEGDFAALLSEELGVDAGDVISYEAMTHDLTPSRLIGAGNEFLAAPRLDNLCSVWSAVRTLVRLASSAPARTVVACLFDHEEVGSGSRSGAQGPLVRTLLERVVLARGGDREAFHRALSDSVCISADMAHATHPNYPDKHERDHHVHMNDGPVIKQNVNLRYASEAETEARFQLACEQAEVPLQKWVMRTDLACGSTIGPITAANLGIPTVDVGCPQLSMHSAREVCGSHDPGYLELAMVEFCKAP